MKDKKLADFLSFNTAFGLRNLAVEIKGKTMASWTNNNSTYYINPAYLTFVENSGYGANLIQVSASSSCYIFVFIPGVIEYSDADKNYRRWKITAHNNKFPDIDKFYIYARLEKSGTSALVVYDKVLRGVHGGEIIEKTDELGNIVKEEGEYDKEHAYYYIHIGEVGATDGTSIRSISYDTGYLTSDMSKNDSGELSEMWELNKYSTPWLIRAKQWLQSFTVKGFITLIGGLIFKKGEIEKTITDIKRSTDNDDEVPVSDSTLPTTKYVREMTDDRFLRKDKDDKTPFNLGVGQNLTVGESVVSEEFTQGELGNGYILKYDKNRGHSYFEVDEALIRKVAYFVELIIKKLSHVGGSFILSPASMRCDKVEEHEEYYRCYFLAEHEGKSINQEFRVNDQARSQTFNVKEGVNHNVSSQYYWRLVVGISEEPTAVDGQKYHYIDLSKIDCDEASLAPLVGDDIVQLGNRTDPTRQNAIILSTVGEDAPSIKQYEGIQFYTLAGKEKTVISPKGNVLVGDFLSKTGEDILKYIDTLGTRLDEVQTQTDRSYTIWFFEYEPTLENIPASEWTDESLKRLHLQDMFYNEDSGRAYRFEMPSEGVFVWNEITDRETIKALEKAAKAQGTADSKIRNFVSQPVPPYEVGDRWSNATFGETFKNDDLVCIKSKGEGESFDIADWQLANGVGTKKFESEIKRLDDEIVLRVTEKQANDIVNEAGVQIKSDVAKIYAKSADIEAALTVRDKAIELKVSADNVINSINVSKENITINADKINLVGKVTFSMFSTDVTTTINGKATPGDIDSKITAYDKTLGALSKKDVVEDAQLGSTIISGGYIKSELLNVTEIWATKGSIGAFSIDGLTLSTTNNISEPNPGNPAKQTMNLTAEGISTVTSGDVYCSTHYGLRYGTIIDNNYYFPIEITHGIGSLTGANMCGLKMEMKKTDIGVYINGGSTHILSSVITRLNGLVLNKRTISTSTSITANDDIVCFDNSSAIKVTFDSDIPVGKIVYLKRTGSGTVTMSGYIRKQNTVNASQQDVGIDDDSVVYIKTDYAWTIFFCG